MWRFYFRDHSGVPLFVDSDSFSMFRRHSTDDEVLSFCFALFRVVSRCGRFALLSCLLVSLFI